MEKVKCATINLTGIINKLETAIFELKFCYSKEAAEKAYKLADKINKCTNNYCERLLDELKDVMKYESTEYSYDIMEGCVEELKDFYTFYENITNDKNINYNMALASTKMLCANLDLWFKNVNTLEELDDSLEMFNRNLERYRAEVMKYDTDTD